MTKFAMFEIAHWTIYKHEMLW